MFHALVSIKQVPDTTNIRIDPETNNLIRQGVPTILNPYDAHAVAAAVEWKRKLGGKVTIITMGPPAAVTSLRECIEMGADRAILISARQFAGADTLATSYVLAEVIKEIHSKDPVSLVFFGKQAIDGDTAQVGPGVAVHLDLPQITYVRKIESIDEKTIIAERLLENGYEVIQSPLPCVLTVVKEINEPRLPSLKGKIAAKKAVIAVWKAADLSCDPKCLGLDGSPTKVVRIFTPPARQGGEMLQGEPSEIVPQLVAKLKDAILGAAN